MQIKFRVTEEERSLIEEKMKQVPTRNMEAYLRKMAIDGYIIQVDHSDIKKIDGRASKNRCQHQSDCKKSKCDGKCVSGRYRRNQRSVKRDMAVTKIKPIKSTFKKALEYIQNPDKTDDRMLVSSFGCSYETADIEFASTLSQALDKGNNLAHHLIQSFEPGRSQRSHSNLHRLHQISVLLSRDYQ